MPSARPPRASEGRRQSRRREARHRSRRRRSMCGRPIRIAEPEHAVASGERDEHEQQPHLEQRITASRASGSLPASAPRRRSRHRRAGRRACWSSRHLTRCRPRGRRTRHAPGARLRPSMPAGIDRLQPPSASSTRSTRSNRSRRIRMLRSPRARFSSRRRDRNDRVASSAVT